MKTLKLLVLSILLVNLSACDGKKSNRKLQEAAEIHEEMMMQYDSIYHALLDKRKEINARIDELAGDQRSANESMLRSINKSLSILQGWEESVIGVPGYQFEHHHHGHDEEDGHHHHHGRDNDQLLKGMKDQEVLDMQKALNSRLNEVRVEISNLLETIKAYEQR